MDACIRGVSGGAFVFHVGAAGAKLLSQYTKPIDISGKKCLCAVPFLVPIVDSFSAQ